MELTNEQIKKWKSQYGVLVGISISEEAEGSGQEGEGKSPQPLNGSNTEQPPTEYKVVLREPTAEEYIGAMDGLSVSAASKTVSVGKSMRGMLELYTTCMLYEPEAVERSGLLRMEASNSFMEYCQQPKKKKITRL